MEEQREGNGEARDSTGGNKLEEGKREREREGDRQRNEERRSEGIGVTREKYSARQRERKRKARWGDGEKHADTRGERERERERKGGGNRRWTKMNRVNNMWHISKISACCMLTLFIPPPDEDEPLCLARGSRD